MNKCDNCNSIRIDEDNECYDCGYNGVCSQCGDVIDFDVEGASAQACSIYCAQEQNLQEAAGV